MTTAGHAVPTRNAGSDGSWQAAESASTSPNTIAPPAVERAAAPAAGVERAATGDRDVVIGGPRAWPT